MEDYKDELFKQFSSYTDVERVRPIEATTPVKLASEMVKGDVDCRYTQDFVEELFGCRDYAAAVMGTVHDGNEKLRVLGPDSDALPILLGTAARIVEIGSFMPDIFPTKQLLAILAMPILTQNTFPDREFTKWLLSTGAVSYRLGSDRRGVFRVAVPWNGEWLPSVIVLAAYAWSSEKLANVLKLTYPELLRAVHEIAGTLFSAPDYCYTVSSLLDLLPFRAVFSMSFEMPTVLTGLKQMYSRVHAVFTRIMYKKGIPNTCLLWGSIMSTPDIQKDMSLLYNELEYQFRSWENTESLRTKTIAVVSAVSVSQPTTNTSLFVLDLLRGEGRLTGGGDTLSTIFLRGEDLDEEYSDLASHLDGIGAHLVAISLLMNPRSDTIHWIFLVRTLAVIDSEMLWPEGDVVPYLASGFAKQSGEEEKLMDVAHGMAERVKIWCLAGPYSQQSSAELLHDMASIYMLWKLLKNKMPLKPLSWYTKPITEAARCKILELEGWLRKRVDIVHPNVYVNWVINPDSASDEFSAEDFFFQLSRRKIVEGGADTHPDAVPGGKGFYDLNEEVAEQVFAALEKCVPQYMLSKNYE